jgi:hypothetical protein
VEYFQRPTFIIFERMSSVEVEAMFEREEGRVRVKPQFREGVTWQLGDARDAGLVGALGLQDIMVADWFLCHMHQRRQKSA